ncbi:uncharacterized protein K452DRAFT_28333 [Aplosporella prunicola CBS 121167]|uniref:Uncharacterized protein n=1 Tax=Aplosporella prunicola CBS 121167 TaxID=1176127 RepID=A0A6A6BDH3_9PEZI|nr:uncharacterized protein K452DRAFT_28333 [Aplosporella prunicola CBS 121167]KAF2142220.1 hypothetical protein K452DRAFT_28333 [Aplosporella prunicola CBS 121167]
MKPMKHLSRPWRHLSPWGRRFSHVAAPNRPPDAASPSGAPRVPAATAVVAEQVFARPERAFSPDAVLLGIEWDMIRGTSHAQTRHMLPRAMTSRSRAGSRRGRANEAWHPH